MNRLPVVGDLLRAKRHLRAWGGDDERGNDGPMIAPGTTALLIQTWTVGNQVRLRVLVNDQLLLFSGPEHTCRLNWDVFGPWSATRLGGGNET